MFALSVPAPRSPPRRRAARLAALLGTGARANSVVRVAVRTTAAANVEFQMSPPPLISRQRLQLDAAGVFNLPLPLFRSTPQCPRTPTSHLQPLPQHLSLRSAFISSTPADTDEHLDLKAPPNIFLAGVAALREQSLADSTSDSGRTGVGANSRSL